MGWFLRKAFRVGPLRLNLSKRGMGASVGVKGARLGVDATGKPYAAGGRYGLYFRQRLGTSQTQQLGGESGSRSGAQSPSHRGRPWWVLVILALLLGIILGVVLARAGEVTRVDLADAPGAGTAHVVMDHATSGDDFQDAMRRRRDTSRSQVILEGDDGRA